MKSSDRRSTTPAAGGHRRGGADAEDRCRALPDCHTLLSLVNLVEPDPYRILRKLRSPPYSGLQA